MGNYRATFRSLKEELYTLIISNSRIADKTILLGADPIHFRVAAAGTKYPGLRSVELEMNIVAADPMIELYSEELMETEVRLLRGREEIFFGFLEISEWNMPCAPGQKQTRQLVAIDALSAYRQKPYYQREFLKASDFLEAIYNEIDHVYQCRLTYLDGTEDIWNSYISTDILQPSDVYAPHTKDENWATYGDVLNKFALGTGTSLMMVGDEIFVYKIASQAVFNNNAVASLRSTNMTLKMIPSVRVVQQNVTLYENLPSIELTKTEKVLSAFPISGKYANLYRGSYKYWEKGQGTGSEYVVCGSEYADETKDLNGECANVCLTAPAKSIDSKMHIVSASSLSGNTQIKIKVDIHQSVQVSEIPDLWNASPIFTSQGAGQYDCITLQIGTTTYNNAQIVCEDATADLKWRTITYTFNVANSVLMSAKGLITILFETDSIGNAYRTFARNIAFVGDGYEFGNEEDHSVEWVASGSELGESMSMETPYGKLQPYGGKIHSEAEIPDAGQMLASYYAHPHPMWCLSLDDTNFNPLGKVLCNGYVCSIESANWNIRMGSIDLELLAD